MAISIGGCGQQKSLATSPPASTAVPRPIVPSGPELTLGQYNAAMAEVNAKLAPAVAEEKAGISDAKRAAFNQMVPKLRATIYKYSNTASGLMDDLARIKPPADLLKFHEAFLHWMRKVIEDGRRAADVTDDTDDTRISALQDQEQADVKEMLAAVKSELTQAHYNADIFIKSGKITR